MAVRILDDHGRVVPWITRLFSLVYFISGIALGWWMNGVYSLRGEADQLVKDGKVVRKIESEYEPQERELDERAENVQRPGCDCRSNNLDFLRGKSGTAGFSSDD